MRKCILSVILLVCIMAAALKFSLAMAEEPLGQSSPIPTAKASYDEQGTTMVPMRAICEWLGAKVEYDAAAKLITAKCADTSVVLRVGDRQALVNGQLVTFVAPVVNRDGITFVPLNFVATTFGADVTCDDATATISVRQGERVGTLKKVKINKIDDAEMVLIPAGEFLMGTSEEDLVAFLNAIPDYQRKFVEDETPQHLVNMDAYYMYKYPVTVAQYRKFCRATKRAMPEEPDWGWLENHPVVNVNWYDAAAYAAWAGVSLPTEAQWEKAAWGGDRRVFQWGDAWPPVKGAGNFADTAFLKAWGEPPFWFPVIFDYTDGYVFTSPVDAFAANPYGLHDLAGNVWEWCGDWYGKNYYKNTPGRNPSGPATGVLRVLRGGSWMCGSPNYFCPSDRSTEREDGNPTDLSEDGGFRCVLRSPEP